ncbi:MAG TPA: hypothetical protein VJ694_01340 [Patescibacteria group bacterium]|nr:hypothetical protein [Patescibacteria group bacterium]
MKAGAFILALLWFAGCVYAGYRLTERSFAWIDGPSAASPAETASPKAAQPTIDLNALKTMTPEQLKAKAKELTPQQMLCLSASISPNRVNAVLAGDYTASEEAAVKKCLQ